MANVIDWVRIKNSAGRQCLFYLNEYFGEIPRFRIEEKRGGRACMWRAKTSMKRMTETKKYLESVYGS